MRKIKMKLAKEANEYILTHGTKEQIEAWHQWWPKEPEEKDYLFITNIEREDEWQFFWTYFNEVFFKNND